MSKTVKPISHDTWSNCYAFTDGMMAEFERARKLFGPFENGHEAIAVIREEYLEIEKFVFGKNQTEEEVENALKECTQLAAMAMAFAVELLK